MSENEKKLLGYLGLCRRMKALKTGESLQEALARKAVFLLILFPELSSRHRERILRQGADVETLELESLDFGALKMKKAHALGICNPGLAQAIVALYRKEEER